MWLLLLPLLPPLLPLPSLSQSPGPSNAMGLPSKLLTHDFLLQPSLNDPIVAPDYDEVDFTDAVMKDPGASPNEAWTCNLRLIDDILEQQHAAAQNATARNAGQVTQNSQNIFPPNTPWYHCWEWRDSIANSQLAPDNHASISSLQSEWHQPMPIPIYLWQNGNLVIFQVTCTYLNFL